MAYPNGVTSTNVLLRLEYNRQEEATAKQYLIANKKTELLAAYDNLLANLTADRATVAATPAEDISKLQQ